jgi:hypothetical protein
MDKEQNSDKSKKALRIGSVTKRFICDSCEEEWEESFKCDKCSGLHYVPEYDENGFDEDGANCLLSTCFNCCNCHSK